VQNYPLEFEPVADYWFLPERRVVIAYLAKRIANDFRPHAASRSLAMSLMQHFQNARAAGILGEPGLVDRHPLGWREILSRIGRVAEGAPDFPEYSAVRMESRRRLAPSLREDLLAFLASEEVKQSESPSDFERIFVLRLRWFPFLSASTLEDLAARQLFFAGYYGIFGGLNAYAVGGSMSFAPILQNTNSGRILSYVRRWASGELPTDTGFDVEGRSGQVNAANYAVASELYGVLNLHQQPFYNGAARGYEAYAREGDASGVQRTQRVGLETREFLKANPAQIERLAKFFENGVQGQPFLLPISMERSADENGWEDACAGTDDIGFRIAREMRAAVASKVNALAPIDRAAIALHLNLDTAMLPWLNRTPVEIESGASTTAPSEVRESPRALPETAYSVQARQARVLTLPPSLEHIGNDALAYLRGGFHVLLAGAPGTGKTTLAQFVGHAWNNGLDRVANSMDMSQAPTTTVASSAWAPFHTIGGILPGEDGSFRVQRGIFIAPTSEANGDWRMRGECIVLDEMNRADLDRCIGELYPLLSHSVSEVVPAGVPGVQRILEDARFRLVSTVNDATIDDIVFPISEGLARRFIRIELQGALEDEVRLFLEGFAVADGEARIQAAVKAVANLFSACRQKDKVATTDTGDRLHFGVGYFGLLGAWVAGRLPMSQEFTEREPYDQAVEMLRTSLRSATRDRDYEQVFRRVAESAM
jgi:MoxR-like ATPase